MGFVIKKHIKFCKYKILYLSAVLRASPKIGEIRIIFVLI